MSIIRTAWMYPDTLYLHGDRGNALALKKISEKLGAEAVLDKVDFETRDFDPMSYDILLFGPGEISSFEALAEDMQRYMDGLKEFVESGRPLIATGTTAALFGNRVIRTDKSEVRGLSMIPVEASEREYVYGDDELIECVYDGRSMEVIGNQIQMVNLSFEETGDFSRFGTVGYGMGNNGCDGIEGVMYKNSVFTNMLGPVLVNNPLLTCGIIRASAAAAGKSLNEENPAFELEMKSLELKKKFINEKQPGSFGK